MSRRRFPGTSVIFVVTPQVHEALALMVSTGMFGKDLDECAHLLMRERLREVEVRWDIPKLRAALHRNKAGQRAAPEGDLNREPGCICVLPKRGGKLAAHRRSCPRFRGRKP